MPEWLSGSRLLAFAIIFAVVVGAWMFRYELLGEGYVHRNRFTGAVCHVARECWFKSGD
jgi:hypothetical protein